MAEGLVGGALLSAFLQVAFDRLASKEVVDYFRGRRLNEGLLKKLNMMLVSVDEVVDDAEQKQITSPNVKAWLDEVKDAVYEAEDLLDEVDFEAFKTKQEAEFQTRSSKVWSFFTASASSFDKEIESRMKQVLDNLEYLEGKKYILKLKEGRGVGVGAGIGRKVSERLPKTSVVHEAGIYGRDGDKEMIIDWLLSKNKNGHHFSVISVVGMGGLGKTTLAQLVYNDQRMKDEFDLMVWVGVSEDFDVTRITRTIFVAITSSSVDIEDINVLQVKLREKLLGKRFLLVLDDVWEENPMYWDALQTPFHYGAQGSRILVTTRNDRVALSMRSTKIHHLKQLLKEDSWLLFAKHAFHDGDPNSNPGLEGVGRKIIQKCKGLPLALKAIGSLLYTKLSYEDWNDILTSEIWEMSDQENNIIPSLRLSYYYLPSSLKRCFAYCSLFSKGYQFKKDELVQLWMAENLLQQPQQNKRIEEVGDLYFHGLVSRSFFQQFSEDKTRFIMHDLLNDLAKYVSGEFSFRLEVIKAQSIPKITRHFSYIRYGHEASKRFEFLYKANRIRTFLPLRRFGGATFGFISSDMIRDLLSKCKCLRVLCLSGYNNLAELPDSIGSLKHLRYLDLSKTEIAKLPDSICLLYNLQTLKLKSCYLLDELPSDLHKLFNLRILDFRRTKVKKLPLELGKLKNLQVLTSFYVGRCSKSDIKQLRALNLRGELSISGLQNVVHPMDALAANLKAKLYIEKLRLSWTKDSDESQNEREVLEKLQPHKSLKQLSIKNYGGTRFPHWFGDNSLSNVVSLELKNCKYCFSLPPLGLLPSLKELSIIGFEGIVSIGPEFYGNNSSIIPFASLESLKFQEMVGWEEWECRNVSGAFPNLKELCISNCPALKGHLPEQLPSLTIVDIEKCQYLVASIPWAPAIHQLELQHCGRIQIKHLPSTVKVISICGFEGSLPEKVEYAIANTDLKELNIYDCPNMGFPLRRCHYFLSKMYMGRSCNCLTSFPLGLFPRLQKLHLCECSNLEMISLLEGQHQSHTSLKKLQISDCPKFVSFSRGGFSAPSLKCCSISNMKILKSLPENMHKLLPSLKKLILYSCPRLESPKGGFPSSLKLLHIFWCPKLVASRLNWDLCSGNLVKLLIEDEEVESFPEEGLLPASLYSVYLHCPNLRTLDFRGLFHLSSLEEMALRDCPRLQCLPEEGLPSSLYNLEIWGDCPLLKQRCQKLKGEDWKKIAGIPCVRIDQDIVT